MSADRRTADPAALVAETRDLWEAKAAFWDERMGDGNAFQRHLVGPATERLLAIEPGERVLDIACGNGVFTRRLAELGASVVATDFSPTFVERARARAAGHADRVSVSVVDATDEAALVALGPGGFDAAVCNMALMDMPDIAPLFRALRVLLRPEGRFVFAIPHPAFNSNAAALGVEEAFANGDIRYVRYVRVSGYLDVPPGKGPGMVGEPNPHWYFHRPISDVFGALFSAGFVIDGLDEPSFPPHEPAGDGPSWRSLHGIPPVLAARARPR